MTQTTTLDTQIINGLQSHLSVFTYSDRELEVLALGILEGVRLAGAEAPLLELSVVTDNLKLMLAGDLID